MRSAISSVLANLINEPFRNGNDIYRQADCSRADETDLPYTSTAPPVSQLAYADKAGILLTRGHGPH